MPKLRTATRYRSASAFPSQMVFSLLIILALLSGCEKITDTVIAPPVDAPEVEQLSVMTYNVYVGASADPLLATTNLLQVPTEVANMYNGVIASDFPSRAASIAKSIKASQPHIVGLQEVSLVRRQSPGDRIAGGEVQAEEVVLDFQQILMDALQAEGLSYQVAAKVENIDIEMPMFTDNGIDDARLTDSDVILTRSDVIVSRVESAHFMNALSIETLLLEVPRGYVAIDATVGGVTYRVVNTHLEAFGEPIRVAQAQELITLLQDETLPIILLGDFNTAAPDGTAYQMLLSAGYVDVWQMEAGVTGNTCCQAAGLGNMESGLSYRIDQVFVRNYKLAGPVVTHTVGDKQGEMLPSGIWPSDHAGVVAHLPVPPDMP